MPKISPQIKKNTFWLVTFQLAKMVFPFLVLPILTHRLSVEVYGNLTFVKTVMNFLQILVDFGFMLSATKDIAKAKPDLSKINQILTHTFTARLVLGLLGFLITLLLCSFMPLLNANLLFTFLSYLAVFLSIFLFDFLFRGLEIIHIIAIRFILMKTLSTLCTILFVHHDHQILLIPLLDILSSIIAILLVIREVSKLHLKFIRPKLKSILFSLKTSFIYFLSDISSTTFNALSTLVIGLVFSSTEVALFGLSIQIIGAIQALLGQLSGGIYPDMIRQKSLQLLKNIFRQTLPLVIILTLFMAIFSSFGLKILGGDKYLTATPIIQILSLTIPFSYCSIILGWPTLGVINQQSAVTFSTITATLFNLISLLILLWLDQLNLISVALIRLCTELVLFSIRFYLFHQHRSKLNP